MRHRIFQAWCRVVVTAPRAVLLSVGALALVSLALGATLTLNTNQLDQLDPNLRAVRDMRRVIDMSGGAGMLVLALRGEDPKRLQAIGDAIAAHLESDERVRTATAKLPIDFFASRAAMYLQTKDLEEIRSRARLWLADVRKRASPFFFEIKKTEPVQLDLSDIEAKYTRLGGKSLDSPYFLSKDQKLLLVRVKPKWDSNELGMTEQLVGDLRAWLLAYSDGGVRLVEDYSPTPSAEPGTVEFGFAGTYQSNYEDSYSMKSSLVPVSGIALLGVCLTLGFFFRRHLFMVVMVMSALVLGVIMTFGFARISIGELNVVTTILGGILLGFGIDFGIHFAYRIRYELRLGRPLEEAVTETVLHSGPASLASAIGVGAAFASLLFSDFKGFSEFGLLAGVGVLLVGTVTYLWVPALLITMERSRPGWVGRLLDASQSADERGASVAHARIEHPWRKLGLAAAVAATISLLAPRVAFEYNSRALMVEGQPSVVLQDEIRERFGDFGDPVAVYTKDLDSARALHDLFTPLDEARFPTVARLLGPYSFVPPRAQQEANAAILTEWRAELAKIDLDSLPPEHEAKFEEAQAYLSAQPFGFDDLPEIFRGLVTHLPSAKAENHGYLSYLYPGVDLWDGQKMLAFADDVETIRTESGHEFHAAGLPILFANLARIVLADGRATVSLTAVFLLAILLIDLRSLKDTLYALLPLGAGMGVMLGFMAVLEVRLNFMNVVVFPIILGYGISHGVYLLHRFREGVSPKEALRSVGIAVACSTLTSMVGWAALLFAAHKGLQSMGIVACLGMLGTLLVSFTVMMPLLQIAHDRRAASSTASVTGREVSDA